MNNIFASRLSALCATIKASQLDYYFIRVQDDYLLSGRKYLYYLTGFTGSNALAVISRDGDLHFFTDGRYTEQVKEELAYANWKIHNISSKGLIEFIGKAKKQQKGKIRIGFDFSLFPASLCEQWLFDADLINDQSLLEICDQHIISALPEVLPYPEQFSGESIDSKLTKIRARLASLKHDAFFVSSNADAAWMLNLRAKYEPYKLGIPYKLFISQEDLFVIADNQELANLIKPYLVKEAKLVLANDFWAEEEASIKLYFDKQEVDYQLFLKLCKKFPSYQTEESIIAELKAIKNNTEIDGFHYAHKQDALGFIEAIAEIKQQVTAGKLINEMQVSNLIHQAKAKLRSFITESFESIIGVDKNSAVIHYHPSETKSQVVYKDSILLIDCGGHYFGGTTDTSRTIVFSSDIKEEYKEYYTRVLKGHIALARYKARKVSGKKLDSLARQFLTEIGEDYPHSTGHGVGNVLEVHESPPAISARYDAEIKPGMVFSNEPGFYKPGSFGIRIENVIVAVQKGKVVAFENFTLVPYENLLIKFELLSKQEIDWLRDYHMNIKEQLYSELSGKGKEYLNQVVEAFSR